MAISCKFILLSSREGNLLNLAHEFGEINNYMFNTSIPSNNSIL